MEKFNPEKKSFADEFQPKVKPYEDWRVGYEVEEFQKMIKSGEAKDYAEAEKIYSKKYLGKYLGNLAKYEEIREDVPFSEKLQFNQGIGYEYRYDDLEKIKDKVSPEVFSVVYNISLKDPRWIEGAVMGLSFDEGLEMIEKTLPKDSKSLYTKYLVNSLVRSKLTPKNADKFLDSPLAENASPDTVVGILNQKDAPLEMRKKIFERYKEELSFYKQYMFGEKSLFRDFDDREEKERGAVDAAIGQIFSEIDEESKGREYTEISDVNKAVSFLKNAVESGVIPPQYQDKLEKISAFIDNLWYRYADKVPRGAREDLAELEVLIEKTSKIKPEEIKGKGLEFITSESGAQKLYLDGEFLCVAANAQFSKNPTNGEVVAWLVSEVLDSDSITGTQNQDRVFGIRKGQSEPTQLFEDHAWSARRYFRIFPPEVTPDGKIKLTRIDGDKTKTLELSV